MKFAIIDCSRRARYTAYQARKLERERAKELIRNSIKSKLLNVDLKKKFGSNISTCVQCPICMIYLKNSFGLKIHLGRIHPKTV